MAFLLLCDGFSKLTKFSANCHLANDWSCFVDHKLQHPSHSPDKAVWFFPHKPEVGGSTASSGGGFFKNYLCKLPIDTNFQLGNISNGGSTCKTIGPPNPNKSKSFVLYPGSAPEQCCYFAIPFNEILQDIGTKYEKIILIYFDFQQFFQFIIITVTCSLSLSIF